MKPTGRREFTRHDDGMLGFQFPLTLSWYLTIEGSEYFQVYLWIAKDLAWAQEWRLFSITVGILALCWFIVPAYHTIRTNNYEEMWCLVGSFLWLFANFWWMSGETHDAMYPDTPSISYKHTQESSHILEAALLWLGVYYLMIVPLNLIQVSPVSLSEYDDGSYKPRFQYFRNFRQYENIHTLFWLAKDLAWIQLNISLWFLFLVPTIIIAVDYVYIASYGANSVVDVAHYLATLIWVFGNIVWALGELFFDSHDDPMRLLPQSKDALLTARWYSSWILISAFLPLIVVYSVWIHVTWSGRLSNNPNDVVVFGNQVKNGYGTHQTGSKSSLHDEFEAHLQDSTERDFFLGGATRRPI